MSWKFVLANSSTMQAIGELSQARSKSISVGLNSPGNLSFAIPLTDSLAASIDPVKTCIIAYRDGTAMWSGPVWTLEESLPDNRMSVSSVGWFELLNHRLLSADTSFTAQDAGSIASSLLADANTQYNTGISIGTIQTSQTRTRSYKRLQNIGAEIKALSEIEAGFDWTIDPETKTLNIYTELKTVTDNHLVYGANLSSLSRSTDSSSLTNKIYVLGKGVSGYSSESGSILNYGLFEEQASLSQVTESEIIGAYANAEIAIKSTPRVIYNLTPFPWTETNSVPRIFEDYNIGDVMYLTCNYGRLIIERQAIRVFGATIAINEEGTERVTNIQTTPS